MLSLPFTLKRCGSAILFAVLSCAGGHAAELGDTTPRSFIGQPLAADIELTSLAPDETANLQVRLASPDVYRGANISMNPALQSLNMSIVRRGQRQFLHISSLKRIDANHVHLFLELAAGGRSVVRATTIWLTPDPAPAPPPLAPEPVASAALLAARARAAMPVPAPALVAVPAPVPVMAQPLSRSSPRHEGASASGSAMPARRGPGGVTPKSGPPAACGEQARQCIALGDKNAALTAKLLELEDKVKMLQEELAPKSVKPKPMVAPATAPLKSKPARAMPAAPKPSAMASRPIMLFAGGAALLLLLIGLAVYLFRRGKMANTSAVPSKYWVLLRKPFGRKKVVEPIAEPSAEPVIE